MKAKITLIVLSFLFSLQTFSQSPNWLWAKSAGFTFNNVANSVTADASGNIIAAGHFVSAITFGSTTLTSAGDYDMFIVKYDTAGNVLWAKSAGGTAREIARSVATDASGNIIAAGSFESAAITFGSITLTNVAYGDILIVKYDTGGNVLWAKSAVGIYQDEAYSVTTDSSGNIIAAGFFESPSLTFGSTTLTNGGIFVAKLGVITVGINEMTNDEFPLTIYPNPTTTEVTLNFVKAARYEVQLRNMIGEVLFKTTTSTEQMKIDLRDFPKGIYFIAVQDEKNNLVVRKIVKM